jgi:hypothetical protein
MAGGSLVRRGEEEDQPNLKRRERTGLIWIGKSFIAATILVTSIVLISTTYARWEATRSYGGGIGGTQVVAAGIVDLRGFLLLVSVVLAVVVSLALLLRRRERIPDSPLISSKPGSHDGRSQEFLLVGSTLRAYWSLLLKRRESIGLREIQRELGFSSPSSAVYQLAKLTQLGLVEKDNLGDYVVRRTVKVGILRDFFFVRGTAIARNEVYCILSILANAVCFILLFSVNAEPLIYLLALIPGCISSGIFWREAASTVKYVRSLLSEEDRRPTAEGSRLI